MKKEEGPDLHGKEGNDRTGRMVIAKEGRKGKHEVGVTK